MEAIKANMIILNEGEKINENGTTAKNGTIANIQIMKSPRANPIEVPNPACAFTTTTEINGMITETVRKSRKKIKHNKNKQ